MMLPGEIWSGEGQGPLLLVNLWLPKLLKKSVLSLLGDGMSPSRLNDVPDVRIEDSSFPLTIWSVLWLWCRSSK